MKKKKRILRRKFEVLKIKKMRLTIGKQEEKQSWYFLGEGTLSLIFVMSWSWSSFHLSILFLSCLNIEIIYGLGWIMRSLLLLLIGYCWWHIDEKFMNGWSILCWLIPNKIEIRIIFCWNNYHLIQAIGKIMIIGLAWI